MRFRDGPAGAESVMWARSASQTWFSTDHGCRLGSVGDCPLRGLRRALPDLPLGNTAATLRSDAGQRNPCSKSMLNRKVPLN